MDYGAGVGTLYTLAKMIGCKKVIYNDLLEDWKNSARLIAEAIGIQMDEYIVGDIDDTLKVLNQKNIQCDIITSRNVIEHIYKLDTFYHAIASAQPTSWIYSSTTANYYNPATLIQHRRLHLRLEKIYLPEREKMILQKAPSL
jgi:2-polyprenyl-3-methyl-5-hydroxy-6-metoxy-1,4-benzoquinol methylase